MVSATPLLRAQAVPHGQEVVGGVSREFREKELEKELSVISLSCCCAAALGSVRSVNACI